MVSAKGEMINYHSRSEVTSDLDQISLLLLSNNEVPSQRRRVNVYVVGGYDANHRNEKINIAVKYCVTVWCGNWSIKFIANSKIMLFIDSEPHECLCKSWFSMPMKGYPYKLINNSSACKSWNQVKPK